MQYNITGTLRREVGVAEDVYSLAFGNLSVFRDVAKHANYNPAVRKPGCTGKHETRLTLITITSVIADSCCYLFLLWTNVEKQGWIEKYK